MGNPTHYYGNYEYEFTWRGKQLVGAYYPSATNPWYYAFEYNEDGLRTRKQITNNSGTLTTEYYYNGSVLMGLKRNGVVLLFSYDASGKVASVKYNGAEYYYLHNAQGDVVKVIDASGATMIEYKYDAWGRGISTTGPMISTLGAIQPFRYRGYVFDWETGLYYLESRYYDPVTGRFISADVLLSTGQGVIGNNAYAYCLDNPVNYYDDGGTKSVEIEDDDGNPANDYLREVGCAASGGGYTPAFRSPISSNFKYNLQQATGQRGEGLDAHHVFPRAFEEKFKAIKIKIHEFGAWWELHSHRQTAYEYNQYWERFFDIKYSTEIAQEKAMELAKKLAELYHYVIYQFGSENKQ